MVNFFSFLVSKHLLGWVMVVHTFKPSILETGQVGLFEFKASQGYGETLSQKPYIHACIHTYWYVHFDSINIYIKLKPNTQLSEVQNKTILKP